MTLSPAWRNRLIQVYSNDLPEDITQEVLPDNWLIQTILNSRSIQTRLTEQRHVNNRIAYYQWRPVEVILSPIADVLYALQLDGVLVALELIRRSDRGNCTSPNLECLMLLTTCNLLNQLQSEKPDDENEIVELLNRFIVVYQNAVKTPDGFVTYS